MDKSTNTVTINNSRGTGLKIKAAVQTTAEDTSLYVKQEPLPSGDLWQPVYRQSEGKNAIGVHINSQHDFYTKVYQSVRNSGAAVEGMDLLLWALAAAEQNNTNEEMIPIFEELRQEASGNLRKLLRNREIPDMDEDE